MLVYDLRIVTTKTSWRISERCEELSIGSDADLCGLKWRRLSTEHSSAVGGGAEPLSEPVLWSFAKCLAADLLCVWRRVAKPEHQHRRELWLFWYGEEPDLSGLVSPELSAKEYFFPVGTLEVVRVASALSSRPCPGVLVVPRCDASPRPRSFSPRHERQPGCRATYFSSLASPAGFRLGCQNNAATFALMPALPRRRRGDADCRAYACAPPPPLRLASYAASPSSVAHLATSPPLGAASRPPPCLLAYPFYSGPGGSSGVVY
ncbi:hypothetical protein HPB50_010683 [Hyalomma asiaticum]|uniref:Uncharacterized protein n=1 Tax=Hyalomma asiaticum TaxID=266040 RepID=A0ACB7SIE1_HYAAI|nr:hypothetical protein HPB50_010683 [Hyalomma asiaticum]